MIEVVNNEIAVDTVSIHVGTDCTHMYQHINYCGYLISVAFMDDKDDKKEHSVDIKIHVAPVLTTHNYEQYGIRENSKEASFHVYKLPIHDKFRFDTNTHIVELSLDIPGIGFSNIKVYNK